MGQYKKQTGKDGWLASYVQLIVFDCRYRFFGDCRDACRDRSGDVASDSNVQAQSGYQGLPFRLLAFITRDKVFVGICIPGVCSPVMHDNIQLPRLDIWKEIARASHYRICTCGASSYTWAVVSRARSSPLSCQICHPCPTAGLQTVPLPAALEPLSVQPVRLEIS